MATSSSPSRHDPTFARDLGKEILRGVLVLATFYVLVSLLSCGALTPFHGWLERLAHP